MKWHTSDGIFDKHKCRLVCMGNLFKQMASEPCMHQRIERDGSITRALTHGDDGLVAIDDNKADQFIADIKKIADVTTELDPTDFCGTRIKYKQDDGRLVHEEPTRTSIQSASVLYHWKAK